MKSFTMKSKQKLDMLMSVLTIQKFVIAKAESHELVIDVPDDRRKEFEGVIGCYIGMDCFMKTVEKTLDSMELSKAKKRRIINEAEQYFVSSLYWKGLTTILVSDFLRTRDTLNLDSFVLFNMKNWSKEIENYIIGFALTPGAEEEIVEVPFEEIFQAMRATLLQKGCPVTQFESIHVHLKEDRLQFLADNGTQLDEAYLTDVLDGQLKIDISGDVENWEKDMFLFPSFCMMFPIKRVTFHRSVSNKIQTDIKRMVREITLDQPLTFIVCPGCDICDS